MKTLIDLRKTAFTYEGAKRRKSIEMEQLITTIMRQLQSINKEYIKWRKSHQPDYEQAYLNEIDSEYSIYDEFLKNNPDIFSNPFNQRYGGVYEVYTQLVKEFFYLFEVPSYSERDFTIANNDVGNPIQFLSTRGLLSLSTISFLANKFADIYRAFSRPSIYLRNFANRGADILNVHWSSIWGIMKGTFRTLFFCRPIDALQTFKRFFGGNKNSLTNNYGSSTNEGKAGIAIAEYAYGNIESPQKQEVIIKPLRNCPMPNYNKNNDCLFNVGKGLKGVIGIVAKSENEEVFGIDEDIIFVGFAGTNNLSNYITDIIQIINAADSVYFASVGIIDFIKTLYPDYRIVVFGHSLGGGLSQFSVAALNEKRISGYGYNSAGLSKKTVKYLPSKLSCNINHYLVDKDLVSRIGRLLGNIVMEKSNVSVRKAHSIINVNNVFNKNQTVYCVVNLN